MNLLYSPLKGASCNDRFRKNEKDIGFGHALRRKHHDGMPRPGRGTKDNRKAQGHE